MERNEIVCVDRAPIHFFFLSWILIANVDDFHWAKDLLNQTPGSKLYPENIIYVYIEMVQRYICIYIRICR